MRKRAQARKLAPSPVKSREDHFGYLRTAERLEADRVFGASGALRRPDCGCDLEFVSVNRRDGRVGAQWGVEYTIVIQIPLIHDSRPVGRQCGRQRHTDAISTPALLAHDAGPQRRRDRRERFGRCHRYEDEA